MISSQTSQVSYTGNASLSTPYPITFRFDDNAWVVVEEIDEDGVETLLSLGSDYTITGNGATTTGNVVTGGGAIPATSTLRITRDTALTQTNSLPANSAIPSPTIEAAFDKLTMAQIDLERRVEDLDQLDIADEVQAATASAAAAAASATAAASSASASASSATAAAASALEVADVRDNVVLYRRYMPVPIPALQSMMKALDRGHDLAFDAYGDSTMLGAGGSTSWVRQLATYLGTQSAAHRVEYRLLNYAGVTLDLTVIQAGTNGRRRFYAQSGVTNSMGFPHTEQRVSPAGADVLILEAEISVEAGSLSGGFPTANINLVGYGSSSYRANLVLSTAGRLSLTWRDAGGTFRGASQSTVSVPALTADVAVRYRAKLICDDGSGTKINLIYEYSTNSGVSWTQVGTTINEAIGGSASSIGVEATFNYWIGHYGGAPVAGVSWYYGCTLIASDDGAGGILAGSIEPCIPERIDFYRNFSLTTSGMMQLLGSPTIYADVIASSGWTLTGALGSGGYLDTNKKTLIRDRAPLCSFIATSYNDTALTRKGWETAMTALKAIIAGQHASVPNWIHVCQFPVPEPGGNYYPLYHNARGAEIIAYAGNADSSYAIDMQQWAYDYDGPLADLLVGGNDVHPSNPTGYAQWAAGIQFCLQEGRPTAL